MPEDKKAVNPTEWMAKKLWSNCNGANKRALRDHLQDKEMFREFTDILARTVESLAMNFVMEAKQIYVMQGGDGEDNALVATAKKILAYIRDHPDEFEV